MARYVLVTKANTTVVRYQVIYFLQSCAPFQHFPSSATLALNLWMVLKAITYLKRFFFCKFTPSIMIEQNRKTIKTHYVIAQIYPITPNNTSKQTTQSRQIYNFYFSQKFHHHPHPNIGFLFLVSNKYGWIIVPYFQFGMRNDKFAIFPNIKG